MRGTGVSTQAWLETQHSILARKAILDLDGRMRLRFQPPRNRHIHSVLASTAATAQRDGVALPGFIPRGGSLETALQIAKKIDPFDRALNAELSARSRTTIRRTTLNTYTVETLRHKTIRRLKWVSLKLQPMRERLAASLPVRTPERKLNIPLIMFLIHHLGYTDKQLPVDLAKGMGIIGNIPPSNELTKRVTAPTTNMARLKANLVARNRTILRHLARTTDSKLQQKCWEMSVAEYEKGWLSKPSLVTQQDRAFTVLSPRFCIAEQNGDQEPKYRVIDDLAKSQVNLTVGASDTYFPQDMDTFMVLPRLQHIYGASNLRMWSLGFPNAYKTIGLNEASKEAAHICFSNPINNRPYKARVLVQPFGSRRAPANWGRVVTFLQFVAGEILQVTTGAFVDDVF